MSDLTDRLVTVVTVLHNDEDLVEPFLAAVVGELTQVSRTTELILVDDNSDDRTAERVALLMNQYSGIRLIRLTRTYGFDVAASAGLDASLGDCVIVMHPRQDPVGPIPWLVSRVFKEGRILVGRVKTLERRLYIRLLRGVVKRMLGRAASANLVESYATYFALPKQAVVAITREKLRIRSLPSIAQSIGFPRATFEYQPIPSKKGFKSHPGILNRVITYLISDNILPLRLATYAGLLACGLNLAYAVYIAMVNLLKGQVAEGWTTLSLQINGLFFFVFVILVIQSEYLGAILQESKEAPSYHVLDDRNGPVVWTQPLARNVVTDSLESVGAKPDDAAG
jgi:glycosyltransferase involved in cell wall biosynthesis